jgi:hypothetical protein
MKRFAKKIVCAVLCLCLCGQSAMAGWGYLNYGGYQPWWNIFAHRTKCMSCEEERLQRFWHDYYDALAHYYKALDHIDWVAYYKNHGYQINAACGGMGCGPCGGCPRIQFAPVFVSPSMQWAVPNGCLTGAPSGPPCCGPGMGPMGQ